MFFSHMEKALNDAIVAIGNDKQQLKPEKKMNKLSSAARWWTKQNMMVRMLFWHFRQKCEENAAQNVWIWWPSYRLNDPENYC